MLARVIEELGKGAFDRKMDPLRRASKCTAEIVGFDTEYESATSKLLSVQLAWGEHTSFTRCGKLSVDALARLCIGLGVPRGSEVMLVSFFSLAELQFLPVKKEAYNWKEYGAGGSLDCDFYSEKWGLTLHVFDLARFFDKQPLSKVAASFGLKKLEWERASVTAEDVHKPGFREYAVNDARLCVQIVALLREQFAQYEVDPINEKTPASTAAAVFRRHWVTESLESGNTRARLAGMKGCWGGRAEALGRGAFPMLYEYDLTSAYPQAAIDLKIMPVQGSWIECETLSKFLKQKGGIAHVQFSFAPECLYPCLPCIQKDCQLYPLEGQEWVTLSEVRAALKMGARLHLLEAWGFSRGTTILCDYMLRITSERKTAQGARKVALKLLANSLIGKFAQRVCDIDVDSLRVEAERQRISVDDLGKLTRDELRALGISPATRIGSVFMPEWNALITGHVRARISQAAADTEAVYIATDAIWTQKPWKDHPKDFELKRQGSGIVARTRLGMIDGETEQTTHVAHHSIWNRKAAMESLGNLRAGSDNTRLKYRTRKPTKLRESLRSGCSLGEWVEVLRTADTRWDFKRELMPDGTSRPWQHAMAYRIATAIDRQERKAREKELRADSGVPPRARERRIYLSIDRQIRMLDKHA